VTAGRAFGSDDKRSSERRPGGLLLSPGEASVSGPPGETPGFRPERQCHTRFARSQCRRSGSTLAVES
jgi:hypothetical protein